MSDIFHFDFLRIQENSPVYETDDDKGEEQDSIEDKDWNKNWSEPLAL